MSDAELLKIFLEHNQFIFCPENSIPEKSMSNRVDAYISGNVLLRVVSDRGQQFIDLAKTETGVWIDVFALAAKIDPTFQVKSGSFSESVKVLSKYWPKLVLEL